MIRKIKDDCGVVFYVNENEVCIDIDIPNSVECVELRGFLNMDMRGTDKIFPNVKKLVIPKELTEKISIPNSLFPNVREVKSYSPCYSCNPCLVYSESGSAADALLNAFCLRENEVLDLNWIREIKPYALDGCKNKRIINASPSLSLPENALTGYCEEMSRFDNGLYIVNGIVYDIDESAETVYISKGIKAVDARLKYKCKNINKLVVEDFVAFHQVGKTVTSNEIVEFTKSFSCKSAVSKHFIRNYVLFANVREINVDKDNKDLKSIDGILYSKDGKILIKCPSQKTGDIIIPDGVEEIGPRAFEQAKVSSVKFPDSLSSLGRHAFMNSYIHSVDFGNGIVSIGDESYSKIGQHIFSNCKNLELVVFPNQVETIGNAAFYNSGLHTVVFDKNIKKIERFAFCGCNDLDDLHFEKSDVSNVVFGVASIVSARNIYISDQELSSTFLTGIYDYDETEKTEYVKITQIQNNRYIYMPKMWDTFSGCSNLSNVPEIESLMEFCNQKTTRMEILEDMISRRETKCFVETLQILETSEDDLKKLLELFDNSDDTTMKAYVIDALKNKKSNSSLTI